MGMFHGFSIYITIAVACLSIFVTWETAWNRLLAVVAVEAILVALGLWMNTAGHGNLTFLTSIAAIAFVPFTGSSWSLCIGTV